MQLSLFGKENSEKHIITISKTDFVDFQRCKYTWYMRKVLHVVIAPTTNMIKGSDIHSIAKHINSSLREGKIKNVDDIPELISNLNLEDEIKGVENFTRYLEYRYKNNMPYIPKMVEEKLEYRVNDNYKIHGIPDVVYFDSNTNSWEIIEYKKSTYKSEEDILLEGMFYGYILENVSGMKVTKVGFLSFEDGYNKSIDYSTKDIKEKIFDMINCLEKTDLTPSPSEDNCKKCIFKNHCPHSKV